MRDGYHVDSEYDDFDHIEKRELLSEYPQILDTVIQILTIARAGGMTEKRFYEIGREILASYSNLKGHAFFPLRDGLIQILLRDDAECKMIDESNKGKRPGGEDFFMNN